jgi:hypothetical protein
MRARGPTIRNVLAASRAPPLRDWGLLGVSLWLAIKFQHDDKTEASVGALFGGGAIAISVMAGGWALLAAGMADL